MFISKDYLTLKMENILNIHNNNEQNNQKQ